MLPTGPTESTVKLVRRGHAASTKRIVFLVLTGLFLLLSDLMLHGGGSVSKEYQLKAAFLYNFAKFVEWPAASNSDNIVIGVLGRNPFGSELEAAVKDRDIKGRKIVVRSVASSADATAVQVLFVGAAEEARFAGMKTILQAAHVLTVGESDDFARDGGIIIFELQDDKVRFQINMGAAQSSGLLVSAQLQKLAVAIRKK